MTSTGVTCWVIDPAPPSKPDAGRYVATMLWLPARRVEVVSVADPFVRERVPSTAPSVWFDEGDRADRRAQGGIGGGDAGGEGHRLAVGRGIAGGGRGDRDGGRVAEGRYVRVRHDADRAVWRVARLDRPRARGRAARGVGRHRRGRVADDAPDREVVASPLAVDGERGVAVEFRDQDVDRVIHGAGVERDRGAGAGVADGERIAAGAAVDGQAVGRGRIRDRRGARPLSAVSPEP